jgi:hypothetical protein
MAFSILGVKLMTTETWDPNQSSVTPSYEIELSFLKKICLFMEGNNSTTIKGCLSQEEVEAHKKIMRQPKEKWLALEKDLSNEELLQLISFFTLAETYYDNWDAEDLSPVIGLAKILRKRGESLDTDLLKWIKTNNPNKFLPYGPLF